jgi:hypothetical protein
MPLNRHSTAVHAYSLMRDMKPGEHFDIPWDILKQMEVPREHPLDIVDSRYVIERLQRWLPFDTEVLEDILTKKITFCRADGQ